MDGVKTKRTWRSIPVSVRPKPSCIEYA